jgi:hypothetical protein
MRLLCGMRTLPAVAGIFVIVFWFVSGDKGLSGTKKAVED